jgi:6-phosphogluconolactonase
MPDPASQFDAYTATRLLHGKRVILPTAEALLDRLALDLIEFARRRASSAGVFHLALSGGDTPKTLYQNLMIDPRFRAMPWTRTHLWIVDDRCVPLDNPKRNWTMLRETLIDHSGIPDSSVHEMLVLDPKGDERYEADLRASLDNKGVDHRLDFVLLGMGPDGHTASLFPQTPALAEKSRWVLFNDGDRVILPRPRLTMTYPIINSARAIAVLCTGPAKFATLQTVSAAGHNPTQYPITGVRPTHPDTEMTWYLDAPAATGVKP